MTVNTNKMLMSENIKLNVEYNPKNKIGIKFISKF